MSEPTAQEMKDFSKQFSLEQWHRLCLDRKFVHEIDKNLINAKKIADKILN
tara:strand:+ start:55375 stop:55527 length:153 start_codon:yes stop_codon:yes gene_type:complete